MAFDFPASPTNGQTYQSGTGPTYVWNGTAWVPQVAGPGDLIFSGAGRRIKGDTANATVSARLLWQDNTTNSLTSLGVIPNGTADSVFVQLFNSSTPDNSSFLNMFAGPTRTSIASAKIGTGSYLPMIFATGGADRLTIDTDGKVGVGASRTTPLSTFDLNGTAAQNVVAVAASAIDCSLGNVFTKTATGALTWTFTNVPASRALTVILELTNGGIGAQTWPASVKWPSGIAPTLTTAGIDILGFFTDDGGTTWRGVMLMQDSK